jgi:hypothetical protein
VSGALAHKTWRLVVALDMCQHAIMSVAQLGSSGAASQAQRLCCLLRAAAEYCATPSSCHCSNASPTTRRREMTCVERTRVFALMREALGKQH